MIEASAEENRNVPLFFPRINVWFRLGTKRVTVPPGRCRSAESTPSRRFSFMAVPAESCSLKAFWGMNPRRDVRLQEMETSVLKFKEIKLNCFYKTTPTFSHAALKCRQLLLFPSHQRIYLQFNVFFRNTSQRWREDPSVCLDSSACPPQIWFLIRTQTEERRRWRWLSNKKRQRLEEGLEGRERE